MAREMNDFDDDDLLEDEEDIVDEEDTTDDQGLDEDEDEVVDEDEEDGEESDEEDDDADDPPWANKRIKKMAERHKADVATIKELKSEVSRLTELTGEEDPSVYARVAEKHGILLKFVKSSDIKTIAKADDLKERFETLQQISDELDDSGQSEYEDGNGKVWSRAEIRKKKRLTEEELKSIVKVAETAKKAARKQMVAVLNAGLKALRSDKQKGQLTKKRQDGRKPSRIRFDDEDYPSRRTRSRSAARRDYSPRNTESSKDRAREELRNMIISEYD